MADPQAQPILVTGATGRQGGAALRHLRGRGFRIRAATRNPDKPEARSLLEPGIELVRLDLDDPALLAQAVEGVYGVFSVQDFRQGAEAEIRQGIALIDAARKAQVQHFVYSSVGSADQNTGIPHFESKARIEEHLRQSGLPFTILRPVFFMENWLAMRSMIDQGVLALPLQPETRLQMIAVDDIGAFVAMAFEHPERWQGRALDIAGDELTMIEICRALSRASGHEVRYQQIPWQQFQERAGDDMTTMWRWFEQTGYQVDIASIRREYPNLSGFERWLHKHWPRREAQVQAAG